MTDIPSGYKQTEVGVIPEDWEVTSLRSLISSLEAGVSVNSVEKDKAIFAHDESILKTSCVLGGKFLQEECKQILPCDIRRAKLNPRRDSIIFSRMNTPALVGECGYVDRDHPNLFMPDRLWMAKLAGQHSASARWLSYLLSFSSFSRAIKDTATGTSGSMKNISKGSLLSVFVPLPTQAEQEAIAEALSDADALIESLEQLIAKKRHLKQGVMQELLTGKRRLPGFSSAWEEKRISEIATPSSEKNSNAEALPVLTCSKHLGFVDSLGFFKNQVFSKDTSTYKIIRRGQIGYPANHIEEGSIGLQNLYQVALVSPIYVVFSLNEGVDSYFLHRVLKLDSYRHKFKTATTSSVDRRGSLRWPAFSEIIVSIPPLPEQAAIAAILSDMDAEIATLETKLAKTRSLKQGMMQELLTGRTRLV